MCSVKEQILTGSLTGLNTKQDIDANSESETRSEGLNSDQDIQSEEIKALSNGHQQLNCLENHSDHDNHIQSEEDKLDTNNYVTNKNSKFQGETEEKTRTKKIEPRNAPPPRDTLVDTPLVPSVLYQHRVRGLVLALLVEPEFNTDPTAREEVVRSMCVCVSA